MKKKMKQKVISENYREIKEKKGKKEKRERNGPNAGPRFKKKKSRLH